MKELHIDELLSLIKSKFNRFNDKRASNVQYEIGDCLQSGLAMFLLKDSSLLEFNNRFAQRADNILRIFKINKCPSDGQMRQILDEVNPLQIERVKRAIIQLLKKKGVFQEFEYFKGWKLLLVDGVHHFSSQKVHCNQCQQRNHENGTITYSHSMLASVVVHPDKKEVLSLLEEPIVQQDGVTKNDCELNACKRLVEKVQTRFLSEKFIWVEDALFANGPHILSIQAKGHRYIIRVKQGSGAGSVIKQYEALLAEGKIKQTTATDKNSQAIDYQMTVDDLKDFNQYKRRKKQLQKLSERTIQEIKEKDKKVTKVWHYVNGLYLNEANKETPTNFIRYEEYSIKEGKLLRRFEWITDIPLTFENAKKVSRAGRSRWMIENETFNTLKNQGYHFEHNFGHGKKHLCTNFSLLMMLAFLIDQIQQLCNELFQEALVKSKRKKYLWEDIRSFFRMLPFDSMEMIYKAIIYGVRVEFFSIQENSR